jgi:hypothetical protein
LQALTRASSLWKPGGMEPPELQNWRELKMKIHRFVIGMLIVIGLSATSCAGSKQLRLSSSEGIPAAQSTVKVSTTDNGNTGIDLEVEHLAPPERVDPNATIYVVWVRGDNAEPQNLGALKVDKDLKGSLAAVTPLRAFELYITAEPSQASTTPAGRKLLYTTVQMKK